jgi:hypothetical protein
VPCVASLEASIKALTGPVGDLGGRWMLHPDTIGDCKEVGYPNGYAYYVTGRGGVLGDVDADVITAAFAFFNPGLVRKMWDRGRAVEGAAASARRYAAACAQFGRTRLAGFAGARRLAELAGQVVANVDVSALALFAGWRAMPLPDDDAAKAYQLVHVLRELRGSAHVVAVAACGLSPLDAVLCAGGAENAERFGWPGPFPEVGADTQSQRVQAESLTDELLIGLFAPVLDAAEAHELAALVEAAVTAMRKD